MYKDKYAIKMYNDEVQKIRDAAKLLSSIRERIIEVGGSIIIPSSSGVQITIDDLFSTIKVLNNCVENNFDIYKRW